MNNPIAYSDPSGLQAGKDSSMNYRGPVYVNGEGNFSNVRSKEYSMRHSSESPAYATSGGRNYQVTRNGWTEVGIPPASDSGGTGSSCCVGSMPDGAMETVSSLLKTAVMVGTAIAAYDRFMSDPQIQFGINASVIGAPLVATHNLGRASLLADDALVIRNGTMTAGNFAKGSGVVADGAGKLAGISVKSANGLSVEQLAVGPLLTKNGQIGVSTAGAIRRAGGTIAPDRPTNPANPFHCQVCGLSERELLKIFEQRPNPAKP